LGEAGFVISVLEIPEVFLKTGLEVLSSLAYALHIASGAG